MSVWSEAWSVVSTIMSGDSWAISQALRTGGAWITGTVFTLVGAFVILVVYRLLPPVERHLERTIMVYAYLGIAAIIFVEVIRRFVFSVQAPWSTTFPPVLFLVMTWFGCAWNIKLRTHLAFSEFRMNMPRPAQMACLTLDAVLWLVFCIIVVVTASRVTANAADNFQILEGTNDFMKWWFLITLPIAFVVMAARIIENWIEDYANYTSGRPMIKQAVIGGETA